MKRTCSTKMDAYPGSHYSSLSAIFHKPIPETSDVNHYFIFCIKALQGKGIVVQKIWMPSHYAKSVFFNNFTVPEIVFGSTLEDKTPIRCLKSFQTNGNEQMTNILKTSAFTPLSKAKLGIREEWLSNCSALLYQPVSLTWTFISKCSPFSVTETHKWQFSNAINPNRFKGSTKYHRFWQLRNSVDQNVALAKPLLAKTSYLEHCTNKALYCYRTSNLGKRSERSEPWSSEHRPMWSETRWSCDSEGRGWITFLQT